MTESDRRDIIEQAFIVTVDDAGFEHFARRPGASTRAVIRANNVLRKREQRFARLVHQKPDDDAIRVWHLLTTNKVQLQAVAATGSPVRAYLTRGPRTTDGVCKVLAIRARNAVEDYKAAAPASAFDQVYSAAVADWPDRDWR